MASLSEYEQLRHKNLEDNKVILEKLMSELKEGVAVRPVRNPGRKHKSHRQSDPVDGPIRRNPSRNARFNTINYSPPRTRARRGSFSSSVSSSSSTSPVTSPNKLQVRFGFFQKPGRKDDVLDDAVSDGSNENEIDDEFEDKLPKRAYSMIRDQRSADEITDEDLALVANYVSEKKYDSFYGTTCHQCRQKTNDMKTICRSPKCFGVRGQFCGPCLRNRYGEIAQDALKNPAWICPPCRGICNCSFCRKKAGKSCTGILIHLARENGYDSVNDYLQSFKK